MTIGPAPECGSCKHFHREKIGFTCDAFPTAYRMKSFLAAYIGSPKRETMGSSMKSEIAMMAPSRSGAEGYRQQKNQQRR